MATTRQDEELKPCQWHPVLRWLLFLPAGCVGCVLAILFVRYLYWFYGEGWFGEGKFLAEYAVRAAEPIGFLAAALWGPASISSDIHCAFRRSLLHP